MACPTRRPCTCAHEQPDGLSTDIGVAANSQPPRCLAPRFMRCRGSKESFCGLARQTAPPSWLCQQVGPNCCHINCCCRHMCHLVLWDHTCLPCITTSHSTHTLLHCSPGCHACAGTGSRCLPLLTAQAGGWPAAVQLGHTSSAGRAGASGGHVCCGAAPVQVKGASDCGYTSIALV